MIHSLNRIAKACFVFSVPSLVLFTGMLSDKCDIVRINIRDISSGQVQIVGALGIPVGRVVTLHVKWVAADDSDDDESKDIEIECVDGRVLDRAIKVNRSDITILCQPDTLLCEGVQKVTGYELFEYGGFPPGTWNRPSKEDSGKRKRMSPIPSARPFGLYSRFYIVGRSR